LRHDAACSTASRTVDDPGLNAAKMRSDSLAGSPPILAAIISNRPIGSKKFLLKCEFHHVPDGTKSSPRALIRVRHIGR
jgi:hypothetical protein